MIEGDERVEFSVFVVADLDAAEGREVVREVLGAMVCTYSRV